MLIFALQLMPKSGIAITKSNYQKLQTFLHPVWLRVGNTMIEFKARLRDAASAGTRNLLRILSSAYHPQSRWFRVIAVLTLSIVRLPARTCKLLPASH
jgi:hypothetical protein